MKSIKEIYNMVWEHEFDIADTEASLKRHRLERARRAAIHRNQATTHRSASPAMASGPALRDSGLVAAHVPSMTRHGQLRMRQRGITVDQVTTLLDFGAEQRSHGASRFFLDRQARARMNVEMPAALRSLHTLDIHVVLADDGRVITAAHRTRRIRRDIQKSFRLSTND